LAVERENRKTVRRDVRSTAAAASPSTLSPAAAAIDFVGGGGGGGRCTGSVWSVAVTAAAYSRLAFRHRRTP